MLLHCISLARVLCATAALAGALSSIDGTASSGSANGWLANSELAVQTNARRLEFADLIYNGGFRLPAERSNDDSFAGGGQALAFNPEKPSLFVSSFAGRVAEVTIPTPIVNFDSNALPVATYVQGFADPTEGRLQEILKSGVLITSLLVHNRRLFGTASIYYDALNEQRFSHFSRSLRLSESSFQGWTQVGEPRMAGFVAGSLAAVPVEWQQRLGGALVSGQCCVPIISRTSWGPAAFAFDPSAVGQRVAKAWPLLYYTAEHPTLGSWNESTERFGQSTEVGGLAIVENTRTALYFGRTGMGEACYGAGTADKSLVGTIGSDGAKYCYDPTSPYKGTHAYPYRYQIWAYDLSDFAAVKSGGKRPWDVVPYAIWPVTFPTAEPRTIIGGVSYDPARRTIYVAQRHADRNEFESRPVIHTFLIR